MEPMEQTSRNVSLLRSGIITAIIALMFVAGYAMYEHGQANRLSAQNQQISASLQNTQGQLASLGEKINAITAAQQADAQEQAARREKASAVTGRRIPGHTAKARVRRDDPRWKQVQEKLDAQGRALDEQGKAIESTRQDLVGAKTELSGSIARTHDELVVLQKKGERNYYEFDLSKAKQFQAKGPVGIKLRKANTKRQYADLDLMVDDANLQQKHVNLYQPVLFYATDTGVPIELVINSISKDHIRGYVSEPKYKRSELAATTPSANAGDAATTASAPQPRQRLSYPKN